MRYARALRRLRGRLAHEHAFTLIELLTVLAILGTVLTAITAVFVSGTHAESDMNDRFQAQQNARLALSKLRREIRCASSAMTTDSGSPAPGPAPSVTLTLGAFCKAAQGAITWSAVPLGPSRYGLFRCQGITCDASGTKWADHLTNNTLFSVIQATATIRPRLQVSLPVDLQPARPGGSYALQDAIAFRNWIRPAP